jgi:hypothetical protein
MSDKSRCNREVYYTKVPFNIEIEKEQENQNNIVIKVNKE